MKSDVKDAQEFVIMAKKEFHTFTAYDRNMGIEYLITYDACDIINITMLLNDDGKPVIYNEWKKE